MVAKKYAYTTILSTDAYLPGVLALFDSIKKTNTNVSDFVVIVNQEIKKETIDRLKQNGIIVKTMPKVNVPQAIKSKNKLFPHWNNTFDKFNVFDLTDYDKVVYLDSDIYVAENIDELFEKQNMSAVASGKSFPGNKYWDELNSGVMVIEPEDGIRQKLIDTMHDMSQRKTTLKKPHRQEKKRFFSNISLLKYNICKSLQGIGDQDVLEEFFDWKNKEELHLDEKFNVFANYSDFYKEKLGITPACYHFIGAKKPWSLTPKENERIQATKSKTKLVEFNAFSEYKKIIYDTADEFEANFSIIMPMKNEENYIEDALYSIKSQNYNNIEILVIDDGSTDNSKQCVERFCEENLELGCKIKTFHTMEGHNGVGGGRNVGLDNATGDYILFLDANDILNEDALKSISRTIALNPEADVFSLGYQLTRLDFEEKPVRTTKINTGKMQETRFFQIGVDTAGQIWDICARRSLYERPKKIRFKENCIFEDLPKKIELFTRTDKKIKAVPHMTHTQFSRPLQGVSGALNIRDMRRLIDAHLEVANLRPDVDTKDKMYINVRMALMPAILAWLTQKAIHNKIDLYRKRKREVEEER